ncbi:MAG: rhomboid family intramembrane serine protease [Xanthomonadales bacterium]|nr:rhomboid family intramembrane serine protease [Xanthomonadales bacterium]
MSTSLPTETQSQQDRRRLRGAFNASLGFVLLLAASFAAQHAYDWTFLSVTPGTAAGLLGLLGAPLLHGSVEHLLANSMALLMLGTLALTAFPKATVRALPLLWLGSGLGAWLLGQPGSHHLGASGLTHGLMFLVFVLGLLRRDRAAIAAGMLVFAFYGGMLMTILPREAGVSWESHLGGALAGVLAAFLFRRSDPMPPRTKYSWEIEEELAREQAARERDTYEPGAPRDVPVLWQRDARETGERGTVLPFRRPGGDATPER